MSRDARRVIEAFYIGLTFGLGALVLPTPRVFPEGDHAAEGLLPPFSPHRAPEKPGPR